MTIREICRRIYELRATCFFMDDYDDDYDERMAERERLCLTLAFHKRACPDASCWCKKEWRQYGEA